MVVCEAAGGGATTMIVRGLDALPIFPCKIDKSPLTPNGFYNAVVGADYSGWPRVGVATGVTIVTVFRGSAMIEIEDWKWGEDFSRYSMHQLVQAMHRNLSEDLDQADLIDLIRAEFLKKARKGEEQGQLTQGVIRKLCERKTKDHRKIDQAMDHLVKCGDIVELNQEGKVGFPTRKWQWQ